MAVFSWNKTGAGDWSDPASWVTAGVGTAPPGSSDSATFGDLASAYTVDVTTTVDVNAIAVAGSTASFSISGALSAFNLNFFASRPMTIEAGGLLHVTENLQSSTGIETITIAGTGAGGHVDLSDFTVGAGLNNVTFDFANTGPTSLNTGVIEWDTGFASGITTATQVITNVARGDEFVIPGADFTGDLVFFNPLNNDLTVRSGATTEFTMDSVFLQSGFTGGFDIVNGNTIEAVCYAYGTMIQTPDGELAIEKLRPGTQVITLVDGEEVPQTVKWVGHRGIDLTRHLRPETVAPIRIERDAIAEGMPHRDLLVSPDHAIFVDAKLFCARQLVNGTTIRQDRDRTAVDYYHVELDQHAILLAEGLPAESYLDTGNSGFFANSGALLVLHPDLTDETNYPTREADSCAPFVTDAASVQPVWQRLADRAAAIGRLVPQRVATTDAALRLLANQRSVRPVVSDSERVIFVLPRGTGEVRLLSRAQSPTEARPWLEDRRRLGVRVKRIVLRGADDVREVPMDHPDLTQGWWAVECDGQLISRWTDGEAVLPLPATRGIVMLEIHLAGAMIYTVDAAPEVGLTEAA